MPQKRFAWVAKKILTCKLFFVAFHCTVCILVKKENAVTSAPPPCFATCPNDWIGLGSKCLYFSDVKRNWTLSQNYCMAQEAQLAQFDTLEELVRKYQEMVCCLFC